MAKKAKQVHRLEVAIPVERHKQFLKILSEYDCSFNAAVNAMIRDVVHGDAQLRGVEFRPGERLRQIASREGSGRAAGVLPGH
jgi:hypothetical protein